MSHMKAGPKEKLLHQKVQARLVAFLGIVTMIGLTCLFSVPTPEPSVSMGNVSTTKDMKKKREGGLQKQSPLAAVSAAKKSSLLERREIDGVDVLLERPATAATPKGILFVGHGCHHSNTDWWPSTPDICPECIGLPEERAIVQMALTEFELVVVAISSVDRSHKCWRGDDGPRVAKVLTTLEKELLASFPKQRQFLILAFGASSGGSFVGHVLIRAMKAMGRPLDGFIAQIAAPDSRNEFPEQIGGHFPVATYITMNKDEGSDEFVKVIVKDIQQRGYHAKHIRLPPLAITANFFHDRIPEYSLEQSKAMVLALEQNNYLVMDNGNNYLAHDPRGSKWRDVLRDHVTCPPDCLVADQSPVSEVLNVAWAIHEMSRDGVQEAIAFIIKNHADLGSLS